jgi:hypothetical protein
MKHAIHIFSQDCRIFPLGRMLTGHERSMRRGADRAGWLVVSGTGVPPAIGPDFKAITNHGADCFLTTENTETARPEVGHHPKAQSFNCASCQSCKSCKSWLKKSAKFHLLQASNLENPVNPG